MRLFVAVEIAPGVVAAALNLIDRLRARAVRLAPLSRISWVTADRLHVTVRFIGRVGEEQAEAIRSSLGPSLALDPFELTVAGAGTFPPSGTPRVVWAGLTEGRDRLMTIEQSISARLLRAGIASEDRPYNPHLTLGRIREGAGLRSGSLLDGVDEVGLGTTTVDAITLFESRLSPKGSTYVALQRTGLKWRAGGA